LKYSFCSLYEAPLTIVFFKRPQIQKKLDIEKKAAKAHQESDYQDAELLLQQQQVVCNESNVGVDAKWNCQSCAKRGIWGFYCAIRKLSL
jgi:hypothetical protein